MSIFSLVEVKAETNYIWYKIYITILKYTGILRYSDNVYYMSEYEGERTCLRGGFDPAHCQKMVMPVRDTLDIINGKWKLPIIGALMHGKKRFKEIARELPTITPRMLSKELKDLEINELVKRKVFDTTPVTVEYEITEYGLSLRKVLDAMREWGTEHRKRLMGTP